MNNTIQYKGYVGSVEFSEEDGIFYGKVMGIRSLISYEGESAKELLDDFHGAIDDYLETCKAEVRSHISPIRSGSELSRHFQIEPNSMVLYL